MKTLIRSMLSTTCLVLLVESHLVAKETHLRVGWTTATWNDYDATRISVSSSGIANTDSASPLYLYATFPVFEGVDEYGDGLGTNVLGALGATWSAIVQDGSNVAFVTGQIIQIAEDGSGSYSACSTRNNAATASYVGFSKIQMSPCNGALGYDLTGVVLVLPARTNVSPYQSSFVGLELYDAD